MNSTSSCAVEKFKIQWFLYFLQYYKSPLPVPSTKVQAPSKTFNTILMTYQITGALYTGP